MRPASRVLFASTLMPISSLSLLTKYVVSHTERGACQCDRCIDAPPDPQAKQPTGHTADLIFFNVRAINEAQPIELIALVKAAALEGEYGPINLFDGHEHGYIEIGGWLGSQEIAFRLMGLGSLLGIWKLLTPRSVLGPDLSDEAATMIAGNGFITIQSLTPHS